MLAREELRKRLKVYMTQYEKEYDGLTGYDEEELEMNIATYICTYFENVYYEPRTNENGFFQIFSAIDALPDEKNPYVQVMNQIEKEFGLDRNIVEVGCGMYPSLAEKIAEKQEIIGKGTITAYDPNLVVKIMDGVTLKKERFTINTPLPENALIIGRKPCEATEAMIRSATKNNVELYLMLCTCNHEPYDLKTKLLPPRKRWYDYIADLVTSTLSPEFSIEKETTTNPFVGDKDDIIKVKKIKR